MNTNPRTLLSVWFPSRWAQRLRAPRWMPVSGAILVVAGCASADRAATDAQHSAQRERVAAVSSIGMLRDFKLVRIETVVGNLVVRHNLDSSRVGLPTRSGAAPANTPLVLWPSIFATSAIHEPMLAKLPSDTPVVLIDGPGHGGSTLTRSPLSMPECGRAMKQVLDALNISRAVVGGTSWGGLVSGEFALAYPAATAGVVMMNTPFFVPPGGPGLGERFIVGAAGWMLHWDFYINGVERSFFLPATRASNAPAVAAFRAHLKLADAAPLKAAVAAVLLDREPLAPRLSGIRAPSLVVAGDQDRMYPLDQQKAASASLPNGRLAVLSAAHIAPVDQPEAVARAVGEFMASLR